eukprot:CAMPEP_0197643006 /NCGR_PEP_ID=MMETSP1338-20131121/16487_1 /TAXON_ID=43686 ORGANISM="Pelagodinium beii, Strain RCC1491" /NCGR_SAMPLE_ID=MMETSP1338 /ASSEMBLY_ACC=CAM_ASM_000754 /LENGTH=2734 /DNA_ID=CAMNT_0043216215 /DNA_START=58 /DNA_END=8262 /DNA_ORIENTATION=+
MTKRQKKSNAESLAKSCRQALTKAEESRSKADREVLLRVSEAFRETDRKARKNFQDLEQQLPDVQVKLRESLDGLRADLNAKRLGLEALDGSFVKEEMEALGKTSEMKTRLADLSQGLTARQNALDALSVESAEGLPALGLAHVLEALVKSKGSDKEEQAAVMNALSKASADRSLFEMKVCDFVRSRMQDLSQEFEAEQQQLTARIAELQALAEAGKQRQTSRDQAQKLVQSASKALSAAEAQLKKAAKTQTVDVATVEKAKQEHLKAQANLKAYLSLERRTEEPFVCLVRELIARIKLPSTPTRQSFVRPSRTSAPPSARENSDKTQVSTVLPNPVQLPVQSQAAGKAPLSAAREVPSTDKASSGKEDASNQPTSEAASWPKPVITPVRSTKTGSNAAPEQSSEKGCTHRPIDAKNLSVMESLCEDRASGSRQTPVFSWFSALKTLLALGAARDLRGARGKAAQQLIAAVNAMDESCSSWLRAKLQAATAALQQRMDFQGSLRSSEHTAMPEIEAEIVSGRELPAATLPTEQPEDDREEEAGDFKNGFTEISVFQQPESTWSAIASAHALAQVPLDASLVLVVGPTGSGKTQALSALAARLCNANEANEIAAPHERSLAFYHDRAVASHPSLGGRAIERFGSAGFSDVTAWTRPFQALSNGQRARAVVAAALESGAVFDDFCATVDQRTACAAAASLGKEVRARGLKHVLVACSRECLAPWLGADYVIRLSGAGQDPLLLKNPVPESERRPKISLKADGVRSFCRGKGGGWQGQRDVGPLAEDASWAAWAAEADAVHVASDSLHLHSTVRLDQTVLEAAGAFDYEFTGSSSHKVHKLPEDKLPAEWEIGLLCGPSGCGKTSLLRATSIFGQEVVEAEWSHLPIVEHEFPSASGLQGRPAAEQRLARLGLPEACWQLPWKELSAGQKHQATLARCLRHGCWVDEFTSNLDRSTAEKVCRGVRAMIDAGELKGIVLATVHEDVLFWLKPDFAFHVPQGQLASRSAGTEHLSEPLQSISELLSDALLFTPPALDLQVSCLQQEQQSTAWRHFKHHHYLSGDLLGCAKCLLVRDASGALVAFHAVAPLPGCIVAAWREHRLVVLPQYQGYGIGPRLSDLVGAKLLASGSPMYAVTAHPRLGAYRDSERGQQLWTPTAMNGKASSQTLSGHKRKKSDQKPTPAVRRICWRHRFTGGLAQAKYLKQCGVDGAKHIRSLDQQCAAKEPRELDEQAKADQDLHQQPTGRKKKSQQPIKPLPKSEPETKKKVAGQEHEAAENDRRMVFFQTSQNPQISELARDHPDVLAEPRNLASVKPPPLDPEKHTLSIPQSVLENGRLSSCQLESVFYAARCFGRKLPSGPYCGYYLGDGTGCGKGRVIAALILHLWNQGHRRHVWVSAQQDLLEDARRDLRDVTAGVADEYDIPVHSLKDYNGKSKLPGEDGVLFTTYALLCGSSGKGNGKGKARGKKRKADEKGDGEESSQSRLDQVVDWLQGSEDSASGMICFDEAHKAKNLVNKLGKPTLTGLTVQQFQERCPDAKVLYSTATGASELKNFAYMDRLGLWGAGTSFESFKQFEEMLSREQLAGFEMLSMEMKALGVYSARMLSWAETDFKTMPLPLGYQQRLMYDSACSFFQDLQESLNVYKDNPLCPLEPRRRAFLDMQLRGLQQRFFRMLLVGFKVPMAVKEVRRCIAEDCNVVISLWHTGESHQKNFVDDAQAEAQAEEEDAEDGEEEEVEDQPCLASARCGPKLMLQNFVRAFMPAMVQETSKAKATEVTWQSWRDSPNCTHGEPCRFCEDDCGKASTKVHVVEVSTEAAGYVRIRKEEEESDERDEEQLLFAEDDDFTSPPCQSSGLASPSACKVKAGMELLANTEVTIWESPASWEAAGTISAGNVVIAAGEVTEHEGYLMVPIQPQGAVELKKLGERTKLVPASKLLVNGKRCRPLFEFQVHLMDDSVPEVNGTYREQGSHAGTKELAACFAHEENRDFFENSGLFSYAAAHVEKPCYKQVDGNAVILWDSRTAHWMLSLHGKIVAFSKEATSSAPLHEWELRSTSNDPSLSGLQLTSIKPLALEAESWAQSLQETLFAKIQDLVLPDNPLDQLLLQLGGHEKVAELSGRRLRLAKASGSSPACLEKRANDGERWDQVNLREQQAFQHGEKRVAIITEAASAGISLHADKRAGEGRDKRSARKRVMLILELPWSAEKAVQQFGRVHRSNQLYAPSFRLLVTDVGGEQRFVAAVSRRMQQLGAITRGDRHAALGDGDMGLAGSDFQGPIGTKALSKLAEAVKTGHLPETFHSCLSADSPGWDELQVEAQQLVDNGQLRLQASSKNFRVGGDVKVADFLNSLLTVPVASQRKIFDMFTAMFSLLSREAEANGEFENGVQSLNASRGKWTPGVKMKNSEALNTDLSTGATTSAHHLSYDTGMPWADAKAIYDSLDGTDEVEGFYQESVFNIGHNAREFNAPLIILLVRVKDSLTQQRYYMAYRPNTEPSNALQQQLITPSLVYQMTRENKLKRPPFVACHGMWEDFYRRSAHECLHAVKFGKRCKNKDCALGCRLFEVSIVAGNLLGIYGCLRETIMQASNRNVDMEGNGSSTQRLRLVRATALDGTHIVGLELFGQQLGEVRYVLKTLSRAASSSNSGVVQLAGRRVGSLCYEEAVEVVKTHFSDQDISMTHWNDLHVFFVAQGYLGPGAVDMRTAQRLWASLLKQGILEKDKKGRVRLSAEHSTGASSP